MKRWAVLFLLVWPFLACGILPGQSNPDQFRWDHLPIRFYLSSDIPDSAKADILSAFEAWESGLNAKIFDFGGTVNLDSDHLSNAYHLLKNVIFVTDRSEAAPSSDGVGAIARTIVRGVTKILDTDIILFEFQRNYIHGREETGDVYSVRTVMLHEVGRMLFGSRGGLDVESVLHNPIYPKGHPLEKLLISQGDIDLFYNIYGDLL